MFVFDNNKRTTNQVVKYTVIAMFVLSTAHIVSHPSRLVLFICNPTDPWHPPLLLVRPEPSGMFVIVYRPDENTIS